MQKVVNLCQLAYIIIIIHVIQNISEMEATVNVPMWTAAAIFQNGRHAIVLLNIDLTNHGADCANSSAKVYIYVFEIKDSQ